MLRRLNRYSAWLLGVLLFIYLASGYALRNPEKLERMSFGLLNMRTAVSLHLGKLDLALLSLFLFHCLTSLRFVLVAKLKKKRAVDVTLGILGACIFALFLYLRS